MSHIGEIGKGNLLTATLLPSKAQSTALQADAPNQIVLKKNVQQPPRSAINDGKRESNEANANDSKNEQQSIEPAGASLKQNQQITEYQQFSIEIKKLKIVTSHFDNDAITISKIPYDDTNANEHGNNTDDIDTVIYTPPQMQKHPDSKETRGFTHHSPIHVSYLMKEPLPESGQNIDIWA